MTVCARFGDGFRHVQGSVLMTMMRLGFTQKPSSRGTLQDVLGAQWRNCRRTFPTRKYTSVGRDVIPD